MRIAMFSVRPYDREFFESRAREAGHEITFFDAPLNAQTASLAAGFEAVCVFVNDRAGGQVIRELAVGGTRLIALRCAGFNNVDLAAAAGAGITVVRVPTYSPHAVAEHAVTLLLALNRKIHRAHARVREGNFALRGLMGFDLNGRTVGVIGTGKIGTIFARIMSGFGCRVIAYDVRQNPECEGMGVTYVSGTELLAAADVISLHCPLVPATRHVVNAELLGKIKPGAILINTSRGGLIDTRAVIDALKSRRLGGLGLDVYEEEENLFFRDLSNEVIGDDVFTRLLTFPNVLITAHQGFFTEEAMGNIAATTIANIDDFAAGRPCPNVVTPEQVKG